MIGNRLMSRTLLAESERHRIHPDAGEMDAESRCDFCQGAVKRHLHCSCRSHHAQFIVLGTPLTAILPIADLLSIGNGCEQFESICHYKSITICFQTRSGIRLHDNVSMNLRG